MEGTCLDGNLQNLQIRYFAASLVIIVVILACVGLDGDAFARLSGSSLLFSPVMKMDGPWHE